MVPAGTIIRATFKDSRYTVLVTEKGLRALRVNETTWKHHMMPCWPTMDAFIGSLPRGSSVTVTFAKPKSYWPIAHEIRAKGVSWPDTRLAMMQFFSAHCAKLGQNYGLKRNEDADSLAEWFVFKGVTPLMGAKDYDRQAQQWVVRAQTAAKKNA